jgi:chromosomal replication initiation ATPase DnaA
MSKYYKPKNVRLNRARKAEEILLMVSREYLISVETMRGNDREARVVRARRDFCLRTKAHGIGCITAAKVLWRNHSTVMYHQRPDMQNRRYERYRATRAEVAKSP